MKRIGSGLQFKVYDLGNGRVEKVPKTAFQISLTSLIWEPYLIFSPRTLRQKIQNAIGAREVSINYFKNHVNDNGLLANLRFAAGKIYQDKVTPLKDVLGKDFGRDKEIIDAYPDFIFNCWGNGFADSVYNLLQNNGIDYLGNIVLMDFAEVDLDKDSVRENIARSIWKKSADYRFRLHGETKKHYEQTMKKALTLDNLDKYWGAKISD